MLSFIIAEDAAIHKGFQYIHSYVSLVDITICNTLKEIQNTFHLFLVSFNEKILLKNRKYIVGGMEALFCGITFLKDNCFSL